MTEGERRQAELEKGRATVARIELSKRFNTEHREERTGARPSPSNKAYRERMQRQVPNR